VSDASLKTAAEFVIQQSRLKLVNGQANAVLHILAVLMPIHVQEAAIGCVVTVRVTLHASTDATTVWGANVPQIIVWMNGDLMSGPPSTIAAQTAESVTTVTKQFVVDWAKQN
jgi:hypothetical protein